VNVTVSLPPVERREESRALPVALLLALSFHGALAFGLPEHAPATLAPPAPPLEVDLAPRPEPARPEPELSKAEAPSAKANTATPPPARSPATAGKLLTALPSPSPASDQPLDFVTGPNGSSYGFGVVARGGTALGEGDRGTNPVARVAVAPPRATPVSDLTALGDLSEKPQLTTPDPCRGYYPASAVVDSASTLVRVVLEADGRVRRADVLSETPTGQGFGLAARHCLAAPRFTSARDHEGRSVATATTVRVHFER
jgi:hypothetical protein